MRFTGRGWLGVREVSKGWLPVGQGEGVWGGADQRF